MVLCETNRRMLSSQLFISEPANPLQLVQNPSMSTEPSVILPTSELPISEEELTLLLLSDSSLPVGGFVSSSGLESFVNHGFMAHCKTDLAKSETLVNFCFSNVQSYANLSAACFYHLHAVIVYTLSLTAIHQESDQTTKEDDNDELRLNEITTAVRNLNRLYDSMCLSPVNRRNSYSQGAAFLLLYTKSFAPPANASTRLERLKFGLINALKHNIRRENWSIHYPISFAFVTGLLELAFDRAIHLHFFLFIRSILSSAVRLNIVGPYLAQKVIFINMKPMLETIMSDLKKKRLSHNDLVECGLDILGQSEGGEDDDGPSTSWPFGEIIQTRHDSCHVRMFNS